MTYFRIDAGNPILFVPKDVSRMKWLTFAAVADHWKQKHTQSYQK